MEIAGAERSSPRLGSGAMGETELAGRGAVMLPCVRWSLGEGDAMATTEEGQARGGGSVARGWRQPTREEAG
jgi:hypothetical protein